MKKILSLMAVSALVLTGCQSDEFAGNVNPSTTNEAISFGVNDVKATRAETIQGEKAAALLNNNFIVYGYKLTGTEDGTAANDQKVFDLYNVNYEKGTADLTQSNTNNWEYVGANPAAGSGASSQSIKYWDYSAKGYVFSAVSGLDITATKITTASDVYGKGWNITIPAGGSLVGLYASARVPVANEWNNTTNKEWRYSNPVTLQFYSAASKVRFAMYETVPGYSIKVDKFYYTDGTEKSSATNFVVDGTFKVLDNTDDAKATVTYYSATEASTGVGIENCPKVEWTTGVEEKSAYMFGTNIQCNTLGTSSLEATYDQAAGAYTYIIPFKKADNTLSLKVDYTLTSTDGSGEVIKVYGATATVPANYTQWKENFAYTYLFKISDKTNGSTVDDPEGPKGLYPITFDACVIAEEEGIQETITSLGEPAITTYAKGEVATVNDEYTAGDVYFSATQASALMNLSTAKVYEVYNYGTGEITEALVEDYQKNLVVLVPVATTEATAVPLQDGSSLTFAATNCYKFAAKAGKTYAIQVNYDTDKHAYKIVKVAGTAAAPTYTVTATTDEVTAVDGKAVVELKADAGVVGAKNQIQIFNGSNDVTAKFNIVETTTAGKYEITLTDALVKEGANGTYTVKFKDEEDNITVNLVYEIIYKDDDDHATVIKNNDTYNVTLKVGGAACSGAKITDVPAGITVTDNGGGTYTIAADATAATGMNYLKIAGKQVDVVVISYSLTDAATGLTSKTITYPEGALPSDIDEDLQIVLMMDNGNVCDVVKDNITIVSSNTALVENKVTSTDSGKTPIITPAEHKGGYAQFTYKDAVFDYTVNYYELKSSKTTIARATESTKLTFLCNDKQLSASTARVTVKKETTPDTWQDKTDGFSLTTSGRDLVFGNVAVAGTYRIEYYNEVGDNVLGYEVITVN